MTVYILNVSNSSMVLSCLLRSFAHFANSSWELVAFISRFNCITSRLSRACSFAFLDVAVGSLR